jgi:hypothetical protein
MHVGSSCRRTRQRRDSDFDAFQKSDIAVCVEFCRWFQSIAASPRYNCLQRKQSAQFSSLPLPNCLYERFSERVFATAVARVRGQISRATAASIDSTSTMLVTETVDSVRSFEVGQLLDQARRTRTANDYRYQFKLHARRTPRTDRADNPASAPRPSSAIRRRTSCGLRRTAGLLLAVTQK